MKIIIDTSVLTLLIITERSRSEDAYQCRKGFQTMLARSASVLIPEICIYEVVRGIRYIMLKNNKKSDERLNELNKLCNAIYDPPLSLSREVLDKAAYLWAKANYQGKISPPGIDVDKLVLAHLEIEKKKNPGRKIIIATQNIKDFQLFNPEDADLWENI